ncbi:MAG: tetratricopeptide repeat protein [bacterium]|nr:tetratricopeptide repeat protein [bacterium]
MRRIDPQSNRLIWLFTMITLLASTAAGQVLQPEREQETAERGIHSSREAQAGADQAADLRPTHADISYADVLAHPDDIEINIQWADNQVARGDLKGAAATLERILLLQPELANVRRYHAIVLFRLDDLDGAEAELSRVRKAQLTAALAASASEYASRIKRRKRRTRGSFSLSGGAQYDSNRNSAPHSDTLLVRDFRFQLGDGLTEDDDYSYLTIGELAFERDVGDQEQHTLFGAISYYNAEQEKQERFDVRSGTGQLGLRLRTPEVDWTLRLIAGLVDLSAEKFVRNVAGEVRGERRLSSSFRAGGLVRVESFDYDGIPDSPRAYERTGLETTVGGDLQWIHSPSHRSEMALGFHNRSAQRRYFSYWGPTLGFRHTWLPGGGQFVLAGASFDWNRYKDAQTFISTKVRREAIIRSRLMYGAPLSFLSRGLIKGPLADIVFSLTAEYLWSSSNLPNFTYDNLKLGFLLTRRWEF